MRNLRMKIATFALALGLGGLGGYAISSSKTPQTATGTLAEGTKVVRRTVHAKRPKVKAATPARQATSRRSLAAEPVSTGSSGSGSSGSSSGRPVHTGSSGSSGNSGGGHKPVNTGSSGASGGGSSTPPVSTGSSGGAAGGAGGGEGEAGGEHEGGDD